MRPLQHLEVAAKRRGRARTRVPRAAVRAQPLQHLEVAALRRGRARFLVPRAAFLARPLQHLEVAFLRRIRARPLVPRAAVVTQPLQHFEVAVPRRFRARPLVPRAAVRAQPLQYLELAALRRVLARLFIPRPVLRAQRLQLLELSAYRRCVAQHVSMCRLQTTSRVHTPQRGQESKRLGVEWISRLRNLAPRRVHRVAHPLAHRAESRQIQGVAHVTQNVRGDEILGQVRDGRRTGVAESAAGGQLVFSGH